MFDAKHKGSYSRAMNKLDRETRARILHLLCEGVDPRRHPVDRCEQEHGH